MSAEEVSDEHCWYVIRTGSKQEQRAISNLKVMLIEGFLPMVKLSRVNPFTGIATSVPGALFPGYAFARFDAARFLHQVSYTRGVRRVVSFGGVPARLDDSIITLMRNQIGEDGFVQVGAKLKTGDHVTVNCSQLARFAGVFEHGLSGKDRVVILLTAVSYQARIVTERKFIEKIDGDGTRSGLTAIGA